ncbi:MAG: hypothetical protein Q8M74_00905 [Chloroflexota bacterium]|nr:hypothetical protein [Chloroflexota bacterium]
MDVRRDVIERLEAAGIDYFVTGSEALAALGVAYRATNDIDLVLDLEPSAYGSRLRPLFEPDYLVNDLIRVPGKWLGSVIHIEAVGKADLILRDSDGWGASAFARRRRIEDPALGGVWITTPEDLLIAKLEFADGNLDGLQGRDCVRIIQALPDRDAGYLRMHAASLGLEPLLDEVLTRAG